MARTVSRRDFVRWAAVMASSVVAASCQPKVTEKVVQETVEVEKIVKETVVVAGTPQVVEKVITVEAAAKEPVRIRFSAWGDVQDKDVYTAMAYEYMKAQSAVIPEMEQYLGGYYEKVTANFAAGNAADIIYMQGWVWQPYQDSDLLLPLNEYIERDGRQSWWPDFEVYHQNTEWRGHTYMTPTDSSGWVQFYNKDLFDKRGVAYPTDDWTWEDFQIAVEQLTHKEGNDTYYGYAEQNAYYFMWVTPARKDGLLEYDRIVEPTKAMWTQPGIVDAMQWYAVDTIQNGWQPDPSVMAGGGISVWSGRVALGWDGNWRLPQLWGPMAVKEGGINYGVTLVPKGSSGKSESHPFVHGHVIAKTSKHPDAAWDFLSFILDEPGQTIIAGGARACGRPELVDKIWAPIVAERYNVDNPGAFARALEQGRSLPIAGQGADMNALAAAGAPMPLARDKMIEGTPAKEALEEMNAGIQAILDTYWEKH